MQTAETVEAIVSQLMEKQRVARQAALVKQLECGCPDSTCADGKSCSHPMRRITAAKTDMSPSPLPSSSNSNSRPPSNSDGSNQVSSTTGTGSLLLQNNHAPRVYSRDSRNHHGQSSSRHCSSSNSANTPPLVLSLSQIQGGGGLLILNSNSANTTTNTSSHQQLVSPVSVASFVCNTNNTNRKNEMQPKGCHMVLKQEAMDTNQSGCIQSPLHNSNNAVHQRSSKMDISNESIRQSVYDTLNCNNQDRRNSISHSSHHSEVIMSSAPSTPSKRMETNHEEEYKQQQNACADNVVVLGADKRENSSLLSNNFFNETLDLSQEDIQRTLSANMPLCSTDINRHQRHESTTENRRRETPNKPNERQQNNTITHEINPMDFINNCDVVVSPTHVVDDDVFVNLDAFDMLGEFPDLEVLDSGHHGLLDVNPSDDLRHEKSSSTTDHNHGNLHPEGTAKITDYSPEWAYPEGGVKVLVTGPWHSAGPYTVLFDTFPVPTTLVQSGVLRCYCPGILITYLFCRFSYP